MYNGKGSREHHLLLVKSGTIVLIMPDNHSLKFTTKCGVGPVTAPNIYLGLLHSSMFLPKGVRIRDPFPLSSGSLIILYAQNLLQVKSLMKLPCSPRLFRPMKIMMHGTNECHQEVDYSKFEHE